MASTAFVKTIKQELKKLDKKQTVHFAWRCGVRALPFLAGNGSFSFWREKERQKHLYAVFYALDIAAVAAAAKVADRAYTAAIAAASSSSFSRSAATAAAFAAASSAAAYKVAATAAAKAAAAAFAAFAANAAEHSRKINFESIILQDLRIVQGKQEPPVSIKVYGPQWDDFHHALENEGCGYWSKLYKDIFDNNLGLDEEALVRRINVPQEIRDQGAAEVAHYLAELEKGAARLNEARIIILGDKGAGKTCIARRLVDPDAPMTADDESTAGVDTTLWQLEEENINVRIWDFAGHTVTHAVHQFFLSERCLYLIVYDGRTEERNRLEYWLNHMKNYGGDSQAMILVNKRDQHRVEIPINSLKEQYSIAGVYDFSIQEDKTELRAFRDEVAAYIQNNPSWEKKEIPQSYYQVKEELEDIFTKGQKEKGREHITKDMFDAIAKKHHVDDAERLLRDLHFLGISLWYKDMCEFNTLVLNPEWISQGVYKIINWVNEQKKYSLTCADFVQVFSKEADRFPKEKHKFLFELMKHYELAYETEKEATLIIPHLLKEDRPATLPDFPVGESLMLQYKAEQPLPPNTISRFIVRHNQEIRKEKKDYLVWRYGVVLQDESGSTALVREEDRTISVSVKGQDKTNYISRLRETLNDIFKSYKSDKPELQYRVVRHGQIPEEFEAKNPLWLPDRKILNYSNDNELFYEDITRQHIDLHYVVKNYNIAAENLMLDGYENQFIADKSIHNTFNFHECNIGLQGSLNDLAQLLVEGNHKEEAKELQNAAKTLELAEQCKTQEEVQKKGFAGRLKRIAEELADENSKLHKSVKGIKNAVSIAQDIAKGYNDIAQWVGWPQVPRPFLKKS
jgi:GTPase SAR1 family protein